MAISKYTQPVQQTLEQYIPLPLDQINKAASAIQERGLKAEDLAAQTEFGLGSMEALAPEYQKFKDTYVNQYKTEAGKLLEQYAGNYSDPEFIRNQKRLITKFSTDPRLQIIKQGNEELKSKGKLAQQMQAEGRTFLNPLASFTGADAQGNLTSKVGEVRGLNFDKNIDALLDPAQKSFVTGKNYQKTNAPAIMSVAQGLINNPAEPIKQELVAYMAQEHPGLKPEQYNQLANQYIADRAKSRISTDFDSGLANYNRALGRDAVEDSRYKAQMDLEYAKLAAKGKKGSGTAGDEATLTYPITYTGDKAMNIPAGMRDNVRILSTHKSERPVGDNKIAPRVVQNAFSINSMGEKSKGVNKQIQAQRTEDRLVYTDESGDIFTPEGKGGAFDKNNLTFKSSDGKVHKLKPVAVREYVTNDKSKYYEPLNETEAALSGFDYRHTQDFKPLFQGLTSDRGGKLQGGKPNVGGGQSFSLGKDITITPELNRQLQATGLSQDPAYIRVSELINKYNKGKGITRAEYDEINKFNDVVTDLLYTQKQQAIAKQYFGTKTAQTQVSKDLLSAKQSGALNYTAEQINTLPSEEE